MLLLRNLLLLCVLVVRVGLALNVGAVGVRRGRPVVRQVSRLTRYSSMEKPKFLDKTINHERVAKSVDQLLRKVVGIIIAADS